MTGLKWDETSPDCWRCMSGSPHFYHLKTIKVELAALTDWLIQHPISKPIRIALAKENTIHAHRS